jgi:hypothetical protein
MQEHARRSWEDIARALNQHAVGAQSKFSRRKVTAIACGTSGREGISLNQIATLETYFAKHGQSVQTKGLFESSILEPLAQRGRVSFVLGAAMEKFGDQFHVVRQWDVKALSELLLGIGRSGLTVQPELHDTLRDLANQNGSWRSYWIEEMKRPDSPSIVGVGSQLANPVVELMLSTMFGVEPFRPGLGTLERVPFHFAWPEDSRPQFQSSFCLSGDELRKINQVVPKEKERGVWVDYPALPDSKEGRVQRMFCTPYGDRKVKMYAVFAAQQRMTGQVLMVVAGVSGPATLGLAKLIANDFRYSLPLPPSETEHGKVVWCVVGVPVEFPEQHMGEMCRVGDAALETELLEWRAGTS